MIRASRVKGPGGSPGRPGSVAVSSRMMCCASRKVEPLEDDWQVEQFAFAIELTPAQGPSIFTNSLANSATFRGEADFAPSKPRFRSWTETYP